MIFLKRALKLVPLVSVLVLFWGTHSVLAVDYQGTAVIIDHTHLDFSVNNSIVVTDATLGTCASDIGKVFIRKFSLYRSAYPSTAASVLNSLGALNWTSFKNIDVGSINGAYWASFQLATMVDGKCNFTLTGDMIHVFYEIVGGMVSLIIPETCSDGIQNQDETDIDLGGICQVYSSLHSDTSEQIGSSFNHLIQTLGTGLTGTLSRIDIKTSNSSFGLYGSRPLLSLYECNDDTYGSATFNGSNCNLLYSDTSNDTSKLEVSTQSFNINSIILNPLKYYFFTSKGNNQFNTLPLYYGSSHNTVDGSCYQFKLSSSITVVPCATMSDLYFNLYGISKSVVPQSPVGCITDCFSNVLFLPGLMGSRLYEQDGSSDNELWLSIFDSDHTKLALDNQGESIDSTIYTKDDTQKLNEDGDETGIVDEVFSLNIYKSFIADLKDWKAEEIIANYAFIPYDWRLSLDDIITNGAINGENLAYNTSQDFSESFINKKLEELQISSKSGKVTIVTHSNGGLVAKALVQKLKDTDNPLYDQIDKIIFVAVPQVGTPDAVLALLHGTELGYGFIMDKDRSRQLSENMPTIYNLLPSAGYFTTVDPAFAVDKVVSFEDVPFFNPQTSQYGVFISNETELKNYVLGTDGRTKPFFSDTVHPNIGNSILYNQAQNVHQILDNWQPSPNTKVIQVAGWGEETIAGLDYKTYLNSSGAEYLSYKPRKVVDGDGIVVVPSALWMSETNPNVERWWVDLGEFNQNNSPDRIHRNILEILNLRDFIKSKITNSVFSDSDNIVVNNTSTLISDGTRLHYTLHSPLTLGIVDSQGRYTGQDPITKEIKEEIPNVTYRQIGDVQFISVPDNIAHTLKLQGYKQGSFSLDVDKQTGNTITEFTSFEGIPSSIDIVVTMDVVPNIEIADIVLEIDQNGDGTIDTTLKATPNGTTVYDVTPPELYVTFDITNKNVIFSAQDLVDPNPIITTTSTSVTLTDSSGNTTVIPFKRLREKPTRFRFTYNQIIRNGVTTVLPNTSIVYDWQEKKGILTDLDTKVTVKGVEKYIFNYKKANDVTIIKEKTSGGIVTTTKPGFVVVTIKTEGDGLKVNY